MLQKRLGHASPESTRHYTRVSDPGHWPRCDVSVEAKILRFRNERLEQHVSEHADLVFSNAGIGGGGSPGPPCLR